MINQKNRIVLIVILDFVIAAILRSNLCDYAHEYIIVKGTIAITAAGADAAARQADE